MKTNDHKLNTIPEALKDMANGKMIIVIDAPHRENEGDFLMAADKVTPEAVNFMIKYGRGLICTPLSPSLAKKLDLPLIYEKNNSPFQTPFTISVDAIKNTTTGISAFDRYETIKRLSCPESKSSDFARPGHIFPLVAQEAGVLKRAGHTEAAVDLAKLSGSRPAGIICEILNEDGTMARFQQLKEIAHKHQLKMISIEDLIKYRRLTEGGFQKEQTIAFPNKYGDNFKLHLFMDKFTQKEYTVITKNIDSHGPFETPVLTRLHSQCFTGDIFGSKRCDCGEQLENAMRAIEKAKQGVLIYLEQEGRGIGLANKIRAYHLQDQGYDTVEANHQLGFATDLRDFSPAPLILKELGINSIKLLSNNPEKVKELENYGITVAETISQKPTITSANKEYLMTKKKKLGHHIQMN